MFNFFISKLLQEGNQCVEKILSNYWIQLLTFRKYDSGFLNQSDCFLRKTTIRNKQTRHVKAHTDWSKKNFAKIRILSFEIDNWIWWARFEFWILIKYLLSISDEAIECMICRCNWFQQLLSPNYLQSINNI